ncbi:MAG: hypothetical protein ABIO49_00620 [Dokdonella sp.]
MKHLSMSLIGAVALTVAIAASAPLFAAEQPATAAPAAASAAPAAPKLHAAMRSLWQGHVEQTRAYAMAVKADDSAAAAKAADGVVANAKQIAGAVGGYYGDAAGKQMLTLLAGHWGVVKTMTDAQHAGDSAANTKAVQDYAVNAGDIAKFLSGANPNLPEDAVRGLMMTHGGHHIQQIGQIMKGDKEGEANTWKMMRAHMDVIADALSDAIAKQFPAKAA